MDKRDDLTRLCDELEQCSNKICYKNEIVCAKKMVRQYIGEDRNKLLKLRALVKMHDESDRTGFLNYLSGIISSCSLCLVIIYNLSPQSDGIKDLSVYTSYACFVLFIILVCIGIYLFFNKKDNKRKSWRRYIDIVLEELSKEIK